MENWIIDLHMHSTMSDGTCSPEELIMQAASLLEQKEEDAKILMALTDHDTVKGLEAFMQKAKSYGDRIIALPGIEISADYMGYEIHMLGFGIDHKNQELLAALDYFQNSRKNRNRKMVDKLRDAGFDLDFDELVAKNGGKNIARPHIASAMMEKGYVSSVKEAFDLYLAEGKTYYVGREKASAEEAIRLIKISGGIPVLAHIMLYKAMDEDTKLQMVSELKAAGLMGIETYYTEFSQDEVAFVEALSESFDLLRTGGSDYHGERKPDIRLFTGWGNLAVPQEVATGLLPVLSEGRRKQI